MVRDKQRALQLVKSMGCEWVVQHTVRTALELVSQRHDSPKERFMKKN